MTYDEIMRKTTEITEHIARLEREIDSLCAERNRLYDQAQELTEREWEAKQNGMV